MRRATMATLAIVLLAITRAIAITLPRIARRPTDITGRVIMGLRATFPSAIAIAERDFISRSAVGNGRCFVMGA